MDPNRKNSELAIPVIAEELQAGVRKVKTGALQIKKTVSEHEEILDQPLVTEEAEVRRVVKNEVVQGPLPVRQQGDTVIVPVVKEVLKVEKQWVLTEELHITKRRKEERSEQTVTLRREEAEIQHLDAEGNPDGPAIVQDARPTSLGSARPSILGPREPRSAPVRRNKIIK